MINKCRAMKKIKSLIMRIRLTTGSSWFAGQASEQLNQMLERRLRRDEDKRIRWIMDHFFKLCPCCNKLWASQIQFISDVNLEIIGYKADFEKLEYGMFFFNHKASECNSTLTINAGQFFNLYEGPVYKERLAGTKQCSGLCINKDNLDQCNNQCECAFVREVINIIKKQHEKKFWVFLR